MSVEKVIDAIILFQVNWEMRVHKDIRSRSTAPEVFLFETDFLEQLYWWFTHKTFIIYKLGIACTDLDYEKPLSISRERFLRVLVIIRKVDQSV